MGRRLGRFLVVSDPDCWREYIHSSRLEFSCSGRHGNWLASTLDPALEASQMAVNSFSFSCSFLELEALGEPIGCERHDSYGFNVEGPLPIADDCVERPGCSHR